MPPAFVLSQNQTLKLMTDKLEWNISSLPVSPGAVPAQIYKLVCLRMRTIGTALKFIDHPEPGGSRRPSRRPHVPSSKPTMSKSRRVPLPGPEGAGRRLIRLSEARNEDRPKWAVPAAVAAYMVSISPSQRLFSKTPKPASAFSHQVRHHRSAGERRRRTVKRHLAAAS